MSADAPAPMYYGDYLKLDQLLDCQHPKSLVANTVAHDEMLFIIVHQTYELWFKQVLYELDSLIALLGQDYIDEKSMGMAVARLERITVIQTLMLEQFKVLETMTPLDFLEFRDLLAPASGFQSYQFRLFENKLGLLPEQRLNYNRLPYGASLRPEHQSLLAASESQLSLFQVVEKWLERTPFLAFGHFDFWRSYRQAVETMLAQEPGVTTTDKNDAESTVGQNSRRNFEALFSESAHQQLQQSGQRRLSYRATQAALLIMLYRDQPILHLPFRLLRAVATIDDALTSWRYHHALMVQRMLGTKMGTGGSSGYAYLKKTADHHKVFTDLLILNTYLIPRSALPALSPEVERELGFYYRGNNHHAS